MNPSSIELTSSKESSSSPPRVEKYFIGCVSWVESRRQTKSFLSTHVHFRSLVCLLWFVAGVGFCKMKGKKLSTKIDTVGGHSFRSVQGPTFTCNLFTDAHMNNYSVRILLITRISTQRKFKQKLSSKRIMLEMQRSCGVPILSTLMCV